MSVSMSSSDDIEAYLAQLKASTTRKTEEQKRQNITDPDSIELVSHSVTPVQEVIAPLKPSPIKSSLKSSSKNNANIADTIHKYESKYVKSASKVIRRSSVVFSLPNDKLTGEVQDTPKNLSLSEDSIMDDELAKYLGQTSILEDSNVGDSKTNVKNKYNFSKISPDSLQDENASGNNLVSFKSNENSSLERKASKAQLVNKVTYNGAPDAIQCTSTYLKGIESLVDSMSLLNENSDLKIVVGERGSRTLSETPEHSNRSSSQKSSRKSIFKSTQINDEDSNSSSCQKYLSSRISRRNSYVYKDECDFVSGTPSDETILTDRQLSQESEIEEMLPVDAASSSAQQVPEVVTHNNTEENATIFRKGETNSNSKHNSKKILEASDNKYFEDSCNIYNNTDENDTGNSERAVSNSPSISIDMNQYSKSDFCSPGNSSVITSKSITEISGMHKKRNKHTSSKPRAVKHSQKSNHKSRRHKHKCSCCSTSSGDSSSSEEDTGSLSSCCHRRHPGRRRRHRHCRRRHKKYDCQNCERLRALLWMVPPVAGGGPSFLQHVASSYPVSKEDSSLHGLRVEDALRQTVVLGRQFLLSQRAMYDAYCTTITSSHRYTTVAGIEEIIRKNRRRATGDEALPMEETSSDHRDRRT